jgi:hypothetical protein
MTSDPAASSERTAAAVGYVCGHLADIRDHLEHLGDTGTLDRLLAAVQADDELTGPLDRLHETLLAGGDVLGVYGSTGRSGGPRPAGIADPVPAEAVFLCPHRRCSRYHWPSPGKDAAPACDIDGTPMVRERLR